MRGSAQTSGAPKGAPSAQAAPQAIAASDACTQPGTSPTLPSPDSGTSEVSAVPSMEPRLLIIAGPSGVGKGTLVRRLRANWPNAFGFSVSHTTRQPRPGEQEGREYFFISREEIESLRDRGDLLEHAEFSGNVYATSVAEVQRIASLGQICLLEIDLVGVSIIRSRHFKGARFVFIEPPSLEELERRLRQRNTETPETLQRRLAHARDELQTATKMPWDLKLLNDSEEKAWMELRDAVSKWFDLPLGSET
ncbi:guanylate kinase, putative [Eimeria tenella]|uniref:guanylate kinase n=1 Tax=Eimeria tenella TaxID=5802 RepID=U6KH56_EIMTE|nr:guanylate kinase, putative [Eimeria tenella]CDJ37289.1 guanylate kinase, putative [Eimeria tenella]|eukprot:XP_013228127.1 guanylate kinase, putative [Eimeria tenella]